MVKHSNRAHALLSASGSSRWMNCTPSPKLEAKMPKSSSRYADEGTLAHEFSENEIRFHYDMISEEEYMEIFERISESEYYNPEFVEYCQVYIDYAIEQFEASQVRSGGKSTIIIEERVDYSEYVKDGFGTSDVSILEPGLLEVIDLKFGKGVKVSPVENSQGKLYGVGSFKNNELIYEFDMVKITIAQPRLDIISSWDISAEDLLNWADTEVRQKALMAEKGEGELNPGDWCKFCKVKARCPALNDMALSEAKEEFSKEDFLDDVEVGLLTDEDLISVYEKSSIIMDWLKTVSEYLLTQAIDGHQWPGYKVVEGKSQRKLIDTEDLRAELIRMKVPKKEFIEEKLITMTAMEKLLKARKPALIEKHIIKPEGSPTLVKASDPREEWSSLHQAKSDFADFDDNDED